MASLSESFRNWLLEPVLKIGVITMAAIDDLNAAVAAQYDAVLPAISSVDAELRRVNELLANGASAEELASALASVNASTNRIKDAVSAVVASPATPNPAPELPEVPAEPLPEEPVDVPAPQ